MGDVSYAPIDAGGASHSVRLAFRHGATPPSTAGLAPGYLQANIVILPAGVAGDFERFCAANAQACPLLAMSRPGDPALPDLGSDIDMRHDLPRYRVFRAGHPIEEASDVAGLWRDDLVTFAIGCSFTFEAALMKAGLKLRHIDQGRNVAMYRTSVPTVAVGRFRGPLVVSMRPLREQDVPRAAAITAQYTNAHGAPVHVGNPAALGIGRIEKPDYGEPVDIRSGEQPVFWACGVTSQVAVETAGLDFFIAHAPGSMLVTDQRHPAFV